MKKLFVILIILSVLCIPVATASFNTGGFSVNNWKNISDPTYNLTTAFPNARVYVESSGNVKSMFYCYNGTSAHSIYKVSKPSGTDVWGTPSKVYENASGFNVTEVSVAIDSNNYFHLAYRFYNNTASLWQIGYMNNSGGTWGTATVLSNASGINAQFPAIAVDSNDQAHIVYGARNSTYTNHTTVVIVNSSNLQTQTLIKGDWRADNNNDSYTYPSIGMNATDVAFVSFHRHNYTSDLFLVGLLTYDGATATSYMIGQNQSRNACLTLNATHVAMTYKAYNTTSNTANLTYVAFAQSNIAVRTHWKELQTYANASYYIYPSHTVSGINGTGGHDILIGYTPYHNATAVAQHSTIVLNDTLYKQAQYNNTGVFSSRIFIFSHTRWSNYNHVNENKTEQIIAWYDGGNIRLSHSVATGTSSGNSLGDAISSSLSEWVPLAIMLVLLAFGLIMIGLNLGKS